MSPLPRRTFLKNASLLAAGLAGSGTFASSAPGQTNSPPNILWLIADDVGPWEFGCYGHPTIRTPNVDRLAREGLVFTHAYVTTSSCSPSRASLFTGKFPHATGAENLHEPLPADQVILPEILAQHGYYTGNAGKLHLGAAARKKIGRVFNKLDDWRTFLDERPKDKPFFLSVGFFDAHRTFDRGCVDPPYEHSEIVVPPYLPDTPEVREDLAGFYDEITRMDGVIGAILQRLEEEGILDNTLVMFLGDNGIPFPRAKTTMYESGIQTPLVFRWPGKFQAGREYSGLTSVVDITPAMLDAVNLPIPEEMQGVSLLKQIADPGHSGNEYIFAEKNWHDLDDHTRAVRDRRYKYIRNAYPEKPLETAADCANSLTFQAMRRMRDAGTLHDGAMLLFRSRRAPEELYDIECDPNEFHNLVMDPAYQTVLVRMRERLDRWIRETQDVSPSDTLPDEFDPETGKRIHPPHQSR